MSSNRNDTAQHALTTNYEEINIIGTGELKETHLLNVS
jgi:hypothetical protein